MRDGYRVSVSFCFNADRRPRYAIRGTRLMKVDRSAKANLDRISKDKMNRLRRVKALPARGGLGDWVVVSEQRVVNGESMEADVFYTWLDGTWLRMGSSSE